MNIHVATIDQLYAAVNNPANAGNKIIIAPGLYKLDATKGLNAGRLELLDDMELWGQAGDATKVIINASGLPDASFNPPLAFPALRTGAIRMGRGFNKIEWITIIGNTSSQALSAIDTDLIWGGGVSRVRIANLIIKGGRTGIDIRNISVASAGRVIEAEIVDNEITGMLTSDPQTQQGQGIIIQNANGAADAVIRATLHGNNVHGNIIGMRAFINNNTNNAKTNNTSISIKSNSDKFDKNQLGIYMVAGLDRGAMATVNGNFLSFKADGTSIQNNQGILTDLITFPCGIFLSGGTSILAGSDASGNRLEMKLKDCILSGNGGSDLIAFGAFSTTPVPAGMNNIVEIQMLELIKKATIVATPSFPAEPAATNTVCMV